MFYVTVFPPTIPPSLIQRLFNWGSVIVTLQLLISRQRPIKLCLGCKSSSNEGCRTDESQIKQLHYIRDPFSGQKDLLYKLVVKRSLQTRNGRIRLGMYIVFLFMNSQSTQSKDLLYFSSLPSCTIVVKQNSSSSSRILLHLITL